MNKDYVTQNEFNIALNKQKKFYHSEIKYGGDVGQSIVGVSGGTTEKIWCFGNLGDVVINVPRTGTYQLTTYLYCASTQGANADLYFTVDGVKRSDALPVMDSTFSIVPFTAFVELTAGQHTVSLIGYCFRSPITLKLRDYAQQQLFIKEL